jgi:hypothetical protein
VFKALAPGPWFNTVSKPKYERLYLAQLALLDAGQVAEDLAALAGDAEPTLLCWEKPPFTASNWCHRRLVASWLQQQLGIDVPELEPVHSG